MMLIKTYAPETGSGGGVSDTADSTVDDVAPQTSEESWSDPDLDALRGSPDPRRSAEEPVKLATPEAPVEAQPTGPGETAPKETPEAPPAQTTEAEKPAEAEPAKAVPEAQTPQVEPGQPFNYNEWLTSTVEKVAPAFQLTEEQAELLVSDPQKIYPQLASRLYLETLTNTLAVVQDRMGAMVASVLENRTTAEKNMDTFFSDNAELDRNNPKHVEAIQQIGAAVVQQNPGISLKDFSKLVGTTAKTLLGVTPAPAPAPAPAPKPTPQARMVPLAVGGTPTAGGDLQPTMWQQLAATEDRL